MTTLEEVEAGSIARARRGWHRMAAVGMFALVSFLILAGLMQRQQSELRQLVEQNQATAHAGCVQRRDNTIIVNSTWSELQRIEQSNQFIDDKIRMARIKTFENAKLAVPMCDR